MSRRNYTDADLVKMLKARVVQVEEKLAIAMQEMEKNAAYKAMFLALKEGFIKMREQYKRHRSRLIELGYGHELSGDVIFPETIQKIAR